VRWSSTFAASKRTRTTRCGLGLLQKNIRVTVMRNTLAKKAFNGTSLEALEPSLVGPTALAYGGESVVDVARALVDWAKKVKNLDLKGAVLDGTTSKAKLASSG
jgi:large subunit ribosomal protein L10